MYMPLLKWIHHAGNQIISFGLFNNDNKNLLDKKKLEKGTLEHLGYNFFKNDFNFKNKNIDIWMDSQFMIKNLKINPKVWDATKTVEQNLFSVEELMIESLHSAKYRIVCEYLLEDIGKINLKDYIKLLKGKYDNISYFRKLDYAVREFGNNPNRLDEWLDQNSINITV